MIYLLDTKFIELENNELYKDLPTERIEKINRLVKDEDKKLSLGAGVLLNFAIRDFCVAEGILCPSFPLNICKNEHGKPTLEDNDIHFNLSHSGKFVVCTIDKTSVGIDIQALKENRNNICRMVLSHKELSVFGNSTTNGIEIFCVKEAILKKSGVGLSFGLKNIELSCENNNIFESKAILTPLTDDGIYSVEGLNDTIFLINGEEKISVSTAILEGEDGIYFLAKC